MILYKIKKKINYKKVFVDILDYFNSYYNYKKIILYKSTNLVEQECPICMKNVELCKTNCNHKFCIMCMNKMSNLKHKFKCPLCRFNFDKILIGYYTMYLKEYTDIKSLFERGFTTLSVAIEVTEGSSAYGYLMHLGLVQRFRL